MTYIRQIYEQMLRCGFTRRSARRVRAMIQNACGYSDPYYDIAKIVELADASLFIDIGCHDGRTLLRFIESGVNVNIAAFDPLLKNIETAKHTLLPHADKIQFVNAAVSDEDGSAVFYLNANDQTSSLLDNDEGNIVAFSEGTQHEAILDVPTVKLDTWIRQAQLEKPRLIIKCDTQGAEGKVISGGIEAFTNNVHAFYGEVMLGSMYEGQSSFQDLRELLENQCGMVLKNIYPCLHDARGEAIQMDVLWVKKDYLR